MKVAPRTRTVTKSHASMETEPNCSLGFHAVAGFFGGDEIPSFIQSEFCVVHSPLTPTHTAKTPTPTTTASQLNAQRISATSGRISKISHRPTSVLAR